MLEITCFVAEYQCRCEPLLDCWELYNCIVAAYSICVFIDVYVYICRDVRQMLLKLVELRSSNWGRVHTAAVASDATPDNDPNYFMVCNAV